VLKLTFLNHCNDRVVNCPLIVKSLGHLLLQFLVADLGSDGNSSLDGVFNPAHLFLKLSWRLTLFGRETALGGI